LGKVVGAKRESSSHGKEKNWFGSEGQSSRPIFDLFPKGIGIRLEKGRGTGSDISRRIRDANS